MDCGGGSSRAAWGSGDGAPGGREGVARPRPVDEGERLRLYLVETRAWCRHCNHELSVESSPRCPGCGRTLTTRDVSAARRTWGSRVRERMGRALRRRYHPERPRRRVGSLRPARGSGGGGGAVKGEPARAEPLTDDERIRLYLLDNDAECPGCGYDLFGLESATCPECGKRLTITALKRGRMRWLTPSFVFGLVGLALGLAGSLWLPVKAYGWMAPEYRQTPLLLMVEGLMLLPAFAVVVAGMKWVNYAMVVARLPRLERWGLALGCWGLAGVVVLVVWWV